jgi:hypothetical protein
MAGGESQFLLRVYPIRGPKASIDYHYLCQARRACLQSAHSVHMPPVPGAMACARPQHAQPDTRPGAC